MSLAPTTLLPTGFLGGDNASVTKQPKEENMHSSARGNRVYVIGAGLGRTGTSSLQHALEVLNYRPYHMFDCMKLGHAELWIEALETGNIDHLVEEIVDRLGYNAFVDEPATAFVPQLAERFPQAKILLTSRTSPLKWAKSVQKLALIHEQLAKSPWIFVPNLQRVSTMAKRIHASRGCSIPQLLAGDLGDCIAFYHQHERDMKFLFGGDKDRLLEYQVQQGWQPLLDFLEHEPGEVLSVPFPNRNGSDEVLRLVMALKMIRFVFYLTLLALASSVFWAMLSLR